MTTEPKSPTTGWLRRNLLILTIAVLIVMAGITIYILTPPQMFGALLDPPKPMQNFSLTSSQGPVTLKDFNGKLVLIFFGYTSCPDVCPTTLANLRQALNLLSTDLASQVQVIFVSVDPQRDTPEKLANYVHIFNPAFIGLTGTKEQIDTVTQNFGIFYNINPKDANGFYSVDHTATTNVLDRQGRLTVMWSNGTTSSEIASDLRNLLKK